MALQTLQQASARDLADDDNCSQGSVDSDPTPRFDTSALRLKYGSPAAVGRSSRSPGNQKLHDALSPNGSQTTSDEGDEDGDDSSVEAFGDIRINHDLVFDDDSKTVVSALTLATRGPPGRHGPTAGSEGQSAADCDDSNMSCADMEARTKELRRIKSNMSVKSGSGGQSTTNASSRSSHAHGSANMVSTNTFYEDLSSDDDSDDELERLEIELVSMLQETGTQEDVEIAKQNFQIHRTLHGQTTATLTKEISTHSGLIRSEMKQAQEQSKRANVQQSAALSKIMGAVGNVEEHTGDILQRLDEWDIRWKQMEELRLRHMLENEQHQADNGCSVSDTTSANAIVAHGSNSVATTTITLSDRAADNTTSPTAAIVVSNIAAGGGGDAVLPSEPGLSGLSATVSGPSIAGGIQGIPPPDKSTSMALTTDNGPASGTCTSSPTLISAPPVAEPLPLADGSTVELASSGTDNPLRPASNANAGTAEDSKAVVGVEVAPAHGGTNLSMAMLSTSTASKLLPEDTFDRPRHGPNPTAGGKPDTNCRRSGPRLKASIGAARTTTSATTPSISTTARTGVGGQKGITRAEVEKENGEVLDRSKSMSGQMPALGSGAHAHNSVPVQLAPRGTASNAIAVAAKLNKSARTSGKGLGPGSRIRIVASTHPMSPEKSPLLLSDLALYKLLKDSQKDISAYDWKKFIPEIRQEGESPLQLLKDSVTKLEAAVDGGILASAGPLQSFIDFLSREATEERLNARQPELCNCWYSLVSKIASEIHMFKDPARRKLLMPTMKVLATRLQDALGSGNSATAANSKECMMRIASLSGLAGYSSVIAALCDGVMQTLASRRKELIRAGCSRPFALAMAIAPDKSIRRCENQGEMISETMVTLIISKSQEVRDAGRLAYHILDSRSINGIILTIDKKLKFRSPKAMSYLRLAKDNAKVEMSEGGDMFSWIKDNDYGHFPLAL